jgi:NAD(P)-dependent dehydrogenase (short-subunit alcohol dehydrogenase family)
VEPAVTDRSLADRVAVVTGAGQGIGRGIALAFGAAGATVAVLGRTETKLERTVAELAERGAAGLAVACDVTRRADVDAAVARVGEVFGRIDVLVNAAHDVRVGPILGITEDDAETEIQSAFLGTLRCMQAAHPWLKASKGKVINLGAATSLKPDNRDHAIYAAVKEAIRSLTRSAAVEWGADGIHVNALIPLAASPAFDEWAAEYPTQYARILETIPLGRMGDAEIDVGRAAVFLAGPGSDYVTGSTLMADGGRGYLR